MLTLVPTIAIKRCAIHENHDRHFMTLGRGGGECLAHNALQRTDRLTP